MKFGILLASICLIAILFSISCVLDSTKGKNFYKDTIPIHRELTGPVDCSGIYRTSEDNLCQVSITITKAGDNYNYQLLYDNQTYTGKLIIEIKEGVVYFTLDGKIDGNEPKTVGGQFLKGNIMIQNYGNSMNEYHYFNNCDEKYIEFIKS